MQKSNSSNKKFNPILPQSSRLTLNSNVKTPLPMVNHKDFKMEIDHQIAKCLDTLDRQGLKFLRQTLRASKMFEFTSQEMLKSPKNTQREEQINSKEIKKEVNQKPQTKNSTRKKEEKKDTKIQNNKPKRNDLSSKLQKNLVQLNIKTGKKQTPIKYKTQKKVQKKVPEEAFQQIQEEIFQTQQEIKEEKPEETNNYQTLNPSPTLQSYENYKYESNKHKNTNQESFINQPLKPFFKKNKNTEQKKDEKDYGRESIEIQKTEDLPQRVIAQQQKIIEEQIIKEKIVKQQEITEQIKEQQKPQQPKFQETQQQNIDMSKIITKIEKLTPNKQLKLFKIIQKLQENKKQDPSQLGLSNHTYKTNKSKPYIIPKVSIIRHEGKQHKQRSKSKSRLIKNDKATSLQGSIVKKINYSMKMRREEDLDVDIGKTEQSHVQSSRSISIKDSPIKVGLQKEDFLNDVSLKKSETEGKMIKIGKKKTKTLTNIKIKIQSNRGHSSLVALNNIYLYTEKSTIFQPSQAHVKIQKNLKLFNKSDDWIVPLQNAEILIDGIPQQIAGIRISNFNKSELQNDKQTSFCEVYINDNIFWRGQLKGGSYQDTPYLTDIRISENHFEFPSFEREQQFSSMVKSIEKSGQVKTEDWLEKDAIQEKMKQIQRQQKEYQSNKKSLFVRNLSVREKPKEDQEVFPLNFSMKKKEPIKLQLNPVQKVSKSTEKKYNLDILQKKQVNKKKQSQEDKQKEDQQKLKRKKKLQKEKQKQIEKKQDLQFAKLLQEINLPDKKQSKGLKVQEQSIIINSIPKKESTTPLKKNNQSKKQKPINQFDDFMNDSIFNDKPKVKQTPYQNKKNNEDFKPKDQEYGQPKKKEQNIDNFIDELNDVMGLQNQQQIGEEFYIPELPKGREISLTLISNWGHNGFMGLNGIQFFNERAEKITPNSINCQGMNSQDLMQKLCKNQLLTSDQKSQLKIPKTKKTIYFTFSQEITFSMIRIWNYNGHRVHSSMGVKLCHIKLDQKLNVFGGEIMQSMGSSEDAHNYAQHILLTQDSQIIKKIGEKDWLANLRNKDREQQELFKSTLENFHRPATKGEVKEQKLKEIENQTKQEIKLPKRLCYEYEPPTFPEGFTIKIILHGTWGDSFFVGLNGIEIFNDKGEDISKKGGVQIRGDPSSVASLEGYHGDKRVVQNLVNGVNRTMSDNNVWLAPLLSDMQKVQSDRINTVTIEYSNPQKVSGINFYNYSKTPERGVREFEIKIDNNITYRGYLRKWSQQSNYTTIPFTKQKALLENMAYLGYNQDNMEQNIIMVNEGKQCKK